VSAGQELMDIGFAHDRTTGKEDWLTPPEIIAELGPFDLDPCSPINRPWDTARKHFTIYDNGLRQPWEGRVWLNPPYGTQTELWLQRLSSHGNGTALIFARTETGAFHPWVWDYADATLFIRGRLNFYTKEGKRGGTSGAPSVLVAYGSVNAEKLRTCEIPGRFVSLVKEGGVA
jgi:hypothetical protein